MADRKFRVLYLTGEGRQPPAGLKKFPERGMDVIVCHDIDRIQKELAGRRVHGLLLAAEQGGPDPAKLIDGTRASPLYFHIPIFTLEPDSGVPITSESATLGAVNVIPLRMLEERGPNTDKVIGVIRRRLDSVYHPVTLLLSGNMLYQRLFDITSKTDKRTFLLLAKLHGLKAYNLHRGYDQGDNLLAAIADSLVEVLIDRGNSDILFGQLRTGSFCIATYEKQAESLCRAIVAKSQRVMRRFYSPFELMRGYISVEDEGHSGDYYLAEVMIAGLEIPVHWDSHPAYLIDLLKELHQHVLNEKTKFKIMPL